MIYYSLSNIKINKLNTSTKTVFKQYYLYWLHLGQYWYTAMGYILSIFNKYCQKIFRHFIINNSNTKDSISAIFSFYRKYFQCETSTSVTGHSIGNIFNEKAIFE